MDFPPCICYMLQGSQLFQRGSEEEGIHGSSANFHKTSMGARVFSESRGFLGNPSGSSFNFLRESMHFLWIFHVFLGNPCIFCWIFPGFSRNPCNSLWIFHVFLGNPCIFCWIFPAFSRESMQLSVDFFRFFLGSPCNFCGFSQVF